MQEDESSWCGWPTAIPAEQTRRFAVAIMQQAKRDLQTREHRASTVEWVRETSRRPFSFDWISEHILGSTPREVVALLFKG